MPKYEAITDDGYPQVAFIYRHEDDGFDIELGEDMYFTNAEASIAAWALNQIAEGRVITALVPPDQAPDGPRYAGFYCQDYTGPTEGVAP